MQHGLGLDDWTRSVADQLAADGFIAVAPDAWSGTGPNGGNRDSFKFDDEAMTTGQRMISPDEHQRRYKAAREWALRLPRANGKTASLGFCYGGSFRRRGTWSECGGRVPWGTSERGRGEADHSAGARSLRRERGTSHGNRGADGGAHEEPSYPHGHSALSRASCRLAGGRSQSLCSANIRSGPCARHEFHRSSLREATIRVPWRAVDLSCAAVHVSCCLTSS
jgi:hypothetical protein